MADNDRVVFPEEVEDAKAEAARGAGDSDSVQETPEKATTTTAITSATAPKIAMRNMIQTPYNCPEGYSMDENGVCREVF